MSAIIHCGICTEGHLQCLQLFTVEYVQRDIHNVWNNCSFTVEYVQRDIYNVCNHSPWNMYRGTSTMSAIIAHSLWNMYRGSSTMSAIIHCGICTEGHLQFLQSFTVEYVQRDIHNVCNHPLWNMYRGTSTMSEIIHCGICTEGHPQCLQSLVLRRSLQKLVDQSLLGKNRRWLVDASYTV